MLAPSLAQFLTRVEYGRDQVKIRPNITIFDQQNKEIQNVIEKKEIILENRESQEEIMEQETYIIICSEKRDKRLILSANTLISSMSLYL